MWHREVKVSKDMFWVGLLAGIMVGGLLGVLLGSGVKPRTRNRLKEAASRVRSKMNGVAGYTESSSFETADETAPIEDQPLEP